MLDGAREENCNLVGFPVEFHQVRPTFTFLPRPHLGFPLLFANRKAGLTTIYCFVYILFSLGSPKVWAFGSGRLRREPVVDTATGKVFLFSGHKLFTTVSSLKTFVSIFPLTFVVPKVSLRRQRRRKKCFWRQQKTRV